MVRTPSRRFSPPWYLGLPVGLLLAPAVAQTQDDGAVWLGTFASGPLGAKDGALGDCRWWLDVQDRQRDEGEHFDLGLVRPGLGWQFAAHWSLWGGYAWVPTDPVGRDPFDEHRTWQQVNWNDTVAGWRVLWRNRLEQRFVPTDGDTGWRLREMLRATTPLPGAPAWYGCVWDELFFDLGDTDWGQREGFRQNRAFAGLGTWFDDAHHVALEVGYLNQWIDRPPGQEDRLNHALSISLWLTF
jgi:hypothetical protein